MPSAFKYPYAEDAYFAFPDSFLHYPDPPKGRFGSDGPLDIQMAVSRDGVVYRRVEHAPYVGLGIFGGPEGGSLYMTVGFLRHANEIYQYYGGYSFTHGAYGPLGNRNIGALFATKQRLDGFVSLDAPMTGGSFSTPLLTFKGNSLTLNMDASAMGEVKVELRDEAGKPIPGHTFDDAEPLGLNYLSVPVTWKGSSDVSSLNGKPVSIAFKLRAVKLYAFQFTEEKYSAPTLWQAPYAPGQPAAAPTDPQELQRLLFMEHGRYVYELELKQKELDEANARIKALESPAGNTPPRK
jgi:hypothetical protein